MAKLNFIQNDFYCCECGNKGIPIARKINKIKEPGHLKKIFCLNCNKETNHVECRELNGYTYKDFLFEFEKGNFENGLRILPYGKFRAKIHNNEEV